MSTELTIQAAKELTALLIAAPPGTFTPSFTAVRRYAPCNDLDALSTLTVSVVAKAVEKTVASRNHVEGEHQIDVAIQKKLAKAEDLGELDALMLVPQQIADYLLGDDENGESRRELDCGVTLMSYTHALYDVSDILTKQAFTSLLTFTYSSAVKFR